MSVGASFDDQIFDFFTLNSYEDSIREILYFVCVFTSAAHGRAQEVIAVSGLASVYPSVVLRSGASCCLADGMNISPTVFCCQQSD